MLESRSGVITLSTLDQVIARLADSLTSREGAMASTVQEIKTSDGRVLAFEETGHPTGLPVFLLHGTPGSSEGPKPRSSMLYRQGVRLISYDRPGYGRSTRHPHRRVCDAAFDVATIADYLEISQFAVVGRSGGGPHALACAALIPDRVMRTVALVSVAPPNAPGLDWYSGMTEDNVEAYTAIDADSSQLAERLRVRADRTSKNPETLMEVLLNQMTVADRNVVKDFAIRRLLTNTYREAVREGPFGWIDDALAFRTDWGFDIAAISGPVKLWHGADDNFSPVSHTLWLSANIASAELEIQEGTAHFGAVEILPRILNDLVAEGHRLERMGLDDPVNQPALAKRIHGRMIPPQTEDKPFQRIFEQRFKTRHAELFA
jgi:pimeloyl-ACP methyl ester carboxylesterase